MSKRLAKRLVFGGIWLSFGQVTALLVSFAGSIFLARVLGPNGYGALASAQAIVLMVYGFIDLGLTVAITRYSAMGKMEYAMTAFLIRNAIGVGVGLIIYFFSSSLSLIVDKPGLAILVKIMSVYLVGFALIDSIKALLIGVGAYSKTALIDLLRSGLRSFLAVALALCGFGVLGSVVGFAVSSILTLLAGIIIARRYFIFPSFSMKIAREVLAFSLPLYLPLVLGAPLGKIVDVHLISRVTTSDFANYSIAVNLYTIIVFVSSSLSSTIFSSLSSMSSNIDYLSKITPKIAIYSSTVVVLLNSALMALSTPLVMLLYGSSYLDSSYYLFLIAIRGFYVAIGGFVAVELLKSLGETRVIFLASIIHTIVYVPLAIVLIDLSKITGLLVSLIIADIIPQFMYVRYVKKVYGIELMLKKNLVMAASTATISLIINYFIAREAHNLVSAITSLLTGFLLILLGLILIILLIFDENDIAELNDLIISVIPSGFQKHFLSFTATLLYLRRRIARIREVKKG